MSAGPVPASPGRRDNGLHSAEWGALVDVDPRLSETLLASLSAAQVPAYVEPAGGLEPVTRAAQLPSRPLDRLWVAPARADAAREVVTAEVSDLTRLLAELDPGANAHGLVQPVPRTAATRVLAPPPLPTAPGTQPQDDRAPGAADDPDAVWREIVEGFGREHDSPVPPWPVSEDIDTRPDPGGGGRARRRTDARPPAPRADPRGSGDADALPGWVEPEAVGPADDEGHYVPPPPPPVPRPTPRRAAAVVVLLLGVVLMFAPSLVGQARTSGVQLFGVLVTVAGAAAFVYLLRDTGGDGDDGAQV